MHLNDWNGLIVLIGYKGYLALYFEKYENFQLSKKWKVHWSQLNAIKEEETKWKKRKFFCMWHVIKNDVCRWPIYLFSTPGHIVVDLFFRNRLTVSGFIYLVYQYKWVVFSSDYHFWTPEWYFLCWNKGDGAKCISSCLLNWLASLFRVLGGKVAIPIGEVFCSVEMKMIWHKSAFCLSIKYGEGNGKVSL